MKFMSAPSWSLASGRGEEGKQWAVGWGGGQGCLVKSTPLCQVVFRGLVFGLGSSVSSFPGHLNSPIAAFVHLGFSPHQLPPAIGRHAGVANKGKVGIHRQESLTVGEECICPGM